MILRLDTLIRLAVAYLVFPSLIFLAGWVRIEAALPSIVVSCLSYLLFCGQRRADDKSSSLPEVGLNGECATFRMWSTYADSHRTWGVWPDFHVYSDNETYDRPREELDKIWKWHVYFAIKPIDTVFYSSFARRGANRHE